MITPTKEAYISGVTFRVGLVVYELIYLDDGSPKEEWFHEELLERILFNEGNKKYGREN